MAYHKSHSCTCTGTGSLLALNSRMGKSLSFEYFKDIFIPLPIFSSSSSFLQDALRKACLKDAEVVDLGRTQIEARSKQSPVLPCRALHVLNWYMKTDSAIWSNGQLRVHADHHLNWEFVQETEISSTYNYFIMISNEGEKAQGSVYIIKQK